jgi:hypothetical protein
MINTIGNINKKINSGNVLRKITKIIINKRNIAISQSERKRIQIFIYTILMTINFT